MASRLFQHPGNIDVAPFGRAPRLAGNAQIDADLLPFALRTPRRPALEPLVPPDRLFSALDGRDLTLAGGRWHLEVYSVTDFCGQRWLQLALDGQGRSILTVKLSPTDRASRVLAAVATWVTRRCPKPLQASGPA